MLKQCLAILLLITTTIYADSQAGFTFKNEPINPACVAMFNSGMADLPYIKSINMNVCQHSNAAYQKTLQATDGSYYFNVNDKDDSEGQYSYKVIGKSANGIYVLSTQASGGGTMVASDLLLLRLNENLEYVFNRVSNPQINNITVLRMLGYVNGGDRCVGGFAEVKLVGNQLNIKQYNGANAVDCSKTKEFSLDLSKLPS